MLSVNRHRDAAGAAVLAGLGGMWILGQLVGSAYADLPLWLQVLAGLVPIHVCAFVAAVAVLLADSGRRHGPGSLLQRLGFGRANTDGRVSNAYVAGSALAAFVATAVAVALCAILLRWLGLPVRGNPLLEAVQQSGEPSAYLALFVAAVVVAPPVEEFLFREVLFRGLWGSRVFGASILSAALFAAVHGVLVQAPALFGLALFLQRLRVRTGSLRASTAVHAIYNLIAVLLLTLAGSG